MIENINNEIRQVIVVRTDLKMPKGKLAVQVAHSSIAFLSNKLRKNLKLSTVEQQWIDGVFTKICLKVESEDELLKIQQQAIENNIHYNLITDAGLTVFNGIPTNTCLALGPDYKSIIDKITSHLKLL